MRNPSSSSSFEIPRRYYLSAQASDAMRKAIANGTWKEHLPSERRLCQLFHVSRPTIRAALHALEKDGLIEIRQGRRNRLRPVSRKTSQQGSRLVALVTHQRFSHIAPATYQVLSEMRAHLAEHGFATEVVVCPSENSRAGPRKLAEFVRQNRVLCCVLISVSKELQQWFSSQAVPALVLGSCHPEVKLPSLDVDHRSICRHAAGIFLGRGHRRFALIVPDSGVAGDLASEQGFREAVEQHTSRAAIRGTVLRHDGSAADIGSKLDTLFNGAHPPTALLVAKPYDTFIVLIYLLKRGLTVPDTISFIARDHDQIFEVVDPPIAHYSPSGDSFAQRLSRLMLQMVRQGRLSSNPILLVPQFIEGGTVKQIAPVATARSPAQK